MHIEGAKSPPSAAFYDDEDTGPTTTVACVSCGACLDGPCVLSLVRQADALEHNTIDFKLPGKPVNQECLDDDCSNR